MKNKIVTWIKIGPHFINQGNIRSVVRYGKGAKIRQISGDDIIVNVSYDKVKELLASSQ